MYAPEDIVYENIFLSLGAMERVEPIEQLDIYNEWKWWYEVCKENEPRVRNWDRGFQINR